MKKFKHFPSELEIKARKLLSDAPRQITNTKICNDTGLSTAWLTAFAKGKLGNASAGRLEALVSYLAKKPITEIIKI
jgi:hypothetical protein